MKKREKQILSQLIMETDYITVESLSNKLNIARRTVFNHLNDVKQFLNDNGYALVTRPSEGIKINKIDNNLKKIINEGNPVFSSYSKERFLTILYLLINEDDKIHISELSEIFSVSRPSIYKITENIDIWLQQFDSSLSIGRDGIKLNSGEKRIRNIIISLIMETEDFLNQLGDKYKDIYKLNKMKNHLIVEEKNEQINKLVNQMKRHFKLDISVTNQDWLCKLINISIVRNECGYQVSMPENRSKIIQEIEDYDEIIKYIKLVYKSILNIDVIISEVYYIYTLLLNSSTISTNKDDEILINKNLIGEIYSYLVRSFNISQDKINIFIENLKYVLIKELSVHAISNYREKNAIENTIINSYLHLNVYAVEIIEIIRKYYIVVNEDILVYNLLFLLYIAIEESKQKIKIGLIHDCNSIELYYLRTIIVNYICYGELVNITDNKENLEKCDIILTTMKLKQDDRNTYWIPKNIKDEDLRKLIYDILTVYERINYDRIVRST